MYANVTSIMLVLILDIHLLINRHLSEQSSRWPVSHDHIAGSSLSSPRSTVFFSWPLTRYWFSMGLQAQPRWPHVNISVASFFARFLWLDAVTRPYYISTKVLTQSRAFRAQVENGLEDVFFLHFSLVSIQFDISGYLWSTLVATQLFKSSIGGM